MTTQTTKYELAILTSGSMGSAFDAPGYPSHTYSVEYDLKRKKENRGGCNIDYALTLDNINPKLKSKIKALIADWHKSKPAIGSKLFNTWVDECIRHWGSLSKALPHINKFYPEFNN